MTTYTVARNDGDRRRSGLTKAEAAEYLCELIGEARGDLPDDVLIHRLTKLRTRPLECMPDHEYAAMIERLRLDDDAAD